MIHAKSVQSGHRIEIYSDLIDGTANNIEVGGCFDVFSDFVKAKSKLTTNHFTYKEYKGNKYFSIYSPEFLKLWQDFVKEGLLPIKMI
jgi:hypothetical protein